MNAKRKGTRNEHRSRRLLEAAGYHVTRSARSLGAWDLIGIRRDAVTLVQVRSNRLPTPIERLALRSFPAPAHCRRLVHIWRDRERSPQVLEL